MKRVAIPGGIFVGLMAIYAWTMTPGNFWIDSAAFAACNQILGLPHSPSFPLYTVLGRVFSVILPTTPASAANIYSALAVAGAGVFFYLLLKHILALMTLPNWLRQLTAVTGTACAFLTVPAWQSAVRAEVYGLQILLSLATIYFFVRSIQSRDSVHGFKFAVLAVFFQGLGCANHILLAMITIPAILSLPLILKNRFQTFAIVRFCIVGICLFLVALTWYLYLPIRSNQNPAINSGRPQTLSATVDAVTRSNENYLPEKAVGSSTGYMTRALHLGKFVFDQTGALVLVGLIIGFIIGIKQHRQLIGQLLIMILMGLGLTVWAADFRLLNFDIVAYSGISILMIILVAFFGLGEIVRRLHDRPRMPAVISVFFVLLVFFTLSGNLYSSDLSWTIGPDRLAETILDQSPPRAIVLVNEDNVLLPLWYHCYALNKRPDLAVISAGALYRPAYRAHLKYLYPDLVYPLNFDRYKIDDLKVVIDVFCRENVSQRPVMIQFGVPGIDAARLIPNGFLFRYTGGNNNQSVDPVYPTVAMLEDIAGNATDLLTKDFIARMAFNYGVYCDRMGEREPALDFFQFAIETDDQNPDYLFRLGLAFLNAGRRSEAILLLKEAAETGEGCPEAEDILQKLAAEEFGQR